MTPIPDDQKQFDRWTASEDAYLLEHWAPGQFAGKRSAMIGAYLGRTKNATISRARKLANRGKALYKQPWTPGDPIPEHLKLW